MCTMPCKDMTVVLLNCVVKVHFVTRMLYYAYFDHRCLEGVYYCRPRTKHIGITTLEKGVMKSVLMNALGLS